MYVAVVIGVYNCKRCVLFDPTLIEIMLIDFTELYTGQTDTAPIIVWIVWIYTFYLVNIIRCIILPRLSTLYSNFA